MTEVNSYLIVTHSDMAMQFWKRHELSYPLLSKMAKIYLTVSPDSVPIEFEPTLYFCTLILTLGKWVKQQS